MDTKGYKAQDYHKMIWQTAKTKTESYFRTDVWSWLGGIIAAVISGGISTYLQNLWSKITIIPVWVSVVTILAGTVLGLAAFVVVLFGWNGLWVVPARLYRDKEIDASLMSLDGVEAEPYPFMAHGTQVMGLKIYNKKPIDIYDVELQIAEIWQDGVKSDREFLVLSFGEGDRFMSTFSRDIIGASKEDVVSVAQIVKGIARIAIQPEIHHQSNWSTGKEVVTKTDNTKHFNLKTNQNYEIKIRMNAVFDKNIPAKAKHIYIGNLIFDGEKLNLIRTR